MEDLSTKLLTLINVSSAKPNNKKRIKFDGLDKPSSKKRRNISTSDETVNKKKEEENTVEEEENTNNIENENSDSDDTNDNGEEVEENDDQQDTFTSHYHPNSDLIKGEIINKVNNRNWNKHSKSNKHLFGAYTEFNLDKESSSLNRNVHISPKFLGHKKHLNDINILSQYKDILVNKDVKNVEHFKQSTCLHIHNHLLRTRNKVLKNNEKLSHYYSSEGNQNQSPPECQDQGFTRPKVLILTPFRNAALDWIKNLDKFSPTTQTDHKVRLYNEYSLPKGVNDKILTAPSGTYPSDHVDTFKGNIDDNFKIGIKLTRKSFKPYSDFYSSDIIIASPLGLKLLFEKTKDNDYLSSIELLVCDKLNVILMQNWSHLLEVFNNLNHIPKESHDCDFSRVKPWYLDGMSKYLRQTIMFSPIDNIEINNLFNNYCLNVEGKLKTDYKSEGVLDQIPEGIKQTFYRFNCDNVIDEPDERFKYFTQKTLPSLMKSAVSSSSTIIFVSSYFDFVRVRNYLKTLTISFAALSEYSSNSEISRVRQAFFTQKVNFLLMSERFHFFRRYKIRGSLTHLFYSLPDHHQFYPEVIKFPYTNVNNIDDIDTSDISSQVIYSKVDYLKLVRIVGSTDAKKLVNLNNDDRFSYN